MKCVCVCVCVPCSPINTQTYNEYSYNAACLLHRVPAQEILSKNESCCLLHTCMISKTQTRQGHPDVRKGLLLAPVVTMWCANFHIKHCKHCNVTIILLLHLLCLCRSENLRAYGYAHLCVSLFLHCCMPSNCSAALLSNCF